MVPVRAPRPHRIVGAVLLVLMLGLSGCGAADSGPLPRRPVTARTPSRGVGTAAADADPPPAGRTLAAEPRLHQRAGRPVLAPGGGGAHAYRRSGEQRHRACCPSPPRLRSPTTSGPTLPAAGFTDHQRRPGRAGHDLHRPRLVRQLHRQLRRRRRCCCARCEGYRVRVGWGAAEVAVSGGVVVMVVWGSVAEQFELPAGHFPGVVVPFADTAAVAVGGRAAVPEWP